MLDLEPDDRASPALEALAAQCIDIARGVRRELGIGMYEAVYQEALALAFADAGIPCLREVGIRPSYRGKTLGMGFRADFLVDGRLVLELKSTTAPHPVHETQLVTYLRQGRWPLGLVLNFGTTPFYVKRKICSEYL